VFHGYLKKLDFHGFLLEIINSLGTEEEVNKTLFIWDRCTAHSINEKDELYGKLTFLRRPVKSPQIVAIELLFSVWRRMYNRFEVNNETNLIRALSKISTKITKKAIKGMYRHCFY